MKTITTRTKSMIDNLRMFTSLMEDNCARIEAFFTCSTKVVPEHLLEPITCELTDELIRIIPSIIPSSFVTLETITNIANIHGFTEFEYIADIEHGWNMVKNNEGFFNGCNFYERGVVTSGCDVAIRYDLKPIRFKLLPDGVTLGRVFEMKDLHSDVAGSMLNNEYPLAPFQIDFIRGSKEKLTPKFDMGSLANDPDNTVAILARRVVEVPSDSIQHQ